MKKLIILLLVFISMNCLAQEGFNYLNLLGGKTIGVVGEENVMVNFEFSKDSYNAWDLYYQVNDISDETVHSGGFGYNSKLFRESNLLMRLRFGAELGVDDDKLFYGGGVGLNFTFFLYNNFALYIFNKNNYLFNANKDFNSDVFIGIKIPM